MKRALSLFLPPVLMRTCGLGAIVVGSLCLTPRLAAQPAAPNYLEVRNPTTTSLYLSWMDTNSDETGLELQRSTDGITFAVRATLAARTPNFTDTGLAEDTTYWYRIRSVQDGNYSSYSFVASGRTTFQTPSPSGWAGADVGNTGAAGADSGTPPTLAMNAGGGDIFGTADAFHGVFRTMTGDFAVVARVDSMTNTHPWAKAGVMIRASLKPDSADVAMLLTAGNVCVFQAREEGAEETKSWSGGWFNAPYWVKLVRLGSLFYGYISPDGANWRLVGVDDITLPNQVYVGVAGSAHNAAAQTAISFSRVDAYGAPAVPSNLHVDNLTGHGGHLTWTDNSSDEDGFRVYVQGYYRDAAMNPVGTTAANVTSFDLTGLGSDTSYKIWVAAMRGGDSWLPVYTDIHTGQASDQIPSAPENLTVTRKGSDALEVRWNDTSANESGFELERTTGNSYTMFSLAANTTVYLDPGLVAGVNYTYRVRAVNPYGDSLYTQPVTEHPVLAPAAPTNLAADGATTTTLHLTWTDNSGNETGFALTRAAAGGDFGPPVNLPANATSYTDTGLAPGTTYSYRLQAYNDFSSDYSNVAVAATTGGSAPPPPSDWTGRDIGATGSAGSESGRPPALTMNAGGGDIFDNADAFHFMSRTANGDTTVVAFVQSMTNTHPWAKAGVMIRASLEPNAPNAAMLLTAGNVCVFQARTAAGATTSSVSGGYYNPPYWVKISRTGNVLAGYISSGGGTWRMVGSQAVDLPAQAYGGVAASAHNTAAQTIVNFTDVNVTTTAAPAAAWTRTAWQAAGSSATVDGSGTAMVLKSTSADLWNRSDGGTFMYQAVTGDDHVSARIDSVTRADPYSKAGLMFRAALDSYAPNVAVVVTPDHGIIFQARRSAGEETTVVRELAGPRAPVRLSLGRTGNNFTAAYSTDEGVTWITLGMVNVALPAGLSLGPVATSHNSAAESTATFSAITH